jgi:hypothetical protein
MTTLKMNRRAVFEEVRRRWRLLKTPIAPDVSALQKMAAWRQRGAFLGGADGAHHRVEL